ncbi:TIGR04222 domain-containing membrane protein [Streptomyces sp. HNM0663]|uniref:TIGR04222 domain-containing membrane protein n=1 Tax=Streptomyces chengmaiensis TaxID=3040919 RepID=A0ABT6HRY2_9ACTN|nr:TIGR04222 domain-containing membrane protein [Streptomyces chengmaiensis]MDH2391081.1 TIGR04222 domain-containing membrane protein [Streptomyces chengmaiensis]
MYSGIYGDVFWVLLLLVAWAAAGLSCVRLCRAAVDAARPAPPAPPDGQPGTVGGAQPLSLYEAAFLAGGPHRVADLTLVSLHRRRRLLLAHTGWATVVDPEGGDDLERSVIGAIGPAGQARIAAVRAAACAAGAVRALGDGLVRAGLAVPEAARAQVSSAVRTVRAAAALTVALAAVAQLTFPQGPGGGAPVLGWFALPLVLTLGCLAIARIEVHPYSTWASPDGQRLLGTLSRGGREGRDGEREVLTAVAVRGVRALDDPALRAALAPGRTAHRGH